MLNVILNSMPMPLVQTSAISLSRLIVDRVAAAAGVLCESVSERVCNFFNIAWHMNQSPALDLRYSPSTTGNRLLARFAFPDTHGLTLNSILAAEGADVAGVLGDLHLLHLLSEGGAISVRRSVNTQRSVEAGFANA
jgi:hypothetical protein